MFLKFNEKVTTLFLDSNSKKFDTSDKVNIVLSPSLYWVKKVSLPLKYVREVKPLLESLFEDILPLGNYSYFTYKKEDVFYIFAYEDKKILDTLKDKGIALTQVKNVYFAQSEFETIENPTKIDEKQSIFMKDSLVILLPSIWTHTEEVLDVNSLSLSKHTITLNQFAHYVDNKSLYTLIAIFVLLTSLVGLEYFIVNQKTTQTLDLRDALFVKHGLKATMMQNRSMLKEYTSLHQRQMKFREYSSYILALNLSASQHLSLLSLKSNKLVAEFTGITKGAEVDIKKALQKQGMKVNASFKNTTWHMEIVL